MRATAFFLLFSAISALPALAQDIVHLALSSPDPESGGFFGSAVTCIDDLDGDSVSDLLVGAMYQDHSGVFVNPITQEPDSFTVPDHGAAYVFSGASGALLHTLVAPASNEALLGGFVAGAGDISGDGIPDMLVGTENYELGATRPMFAYAFSGADGSILYEFMPGGAVAGVGDLDGDETPDLLVATFKADIIMDWTSLGRAYIYSGSTGDTLYTLRSPSVVPPIQYPDSYGNTFGHGIAGVDDLDGDGVRDLFIGSIEPIEYGGSRAFVFSGRSGTLLRTIHDPNPYLFSAFGHSVASLGDLTGDGRSELIVGDYLYASADSLYGLNEQHAGRAYIFSGSAGTSGVPLPPVFTLSSPSPENDGEFGFAVAGVGDLSGDGIGDFIVSARREEVQGSFEKDQGKVYLFSGATGQPFATLVSPEYQMGDGHFFGFSVARCGDLTGDGSPEIMVGAPGEEVGGMGASGRVYVFSGGALATPVEPGEASVAFSLSPASPNPFSRSADLAYTLDQAGHVRLEVFDVMGRSVALLVDGFRPAGRHEAVFHPQGLANGVYFTRLSSGKRTEVRAVFLAR